MKLMKLTKLRLVLDVDFDPNGVDRDALVRQMHDVVNRAVNNGTLTGDSDATVEKYSFKVTQRRTKKKKKVETPTLPHICAVCGAKAITTRNISINGAPKATYPLCEIHADAADEDAEQQRRDEKHGLFGDKTDIAN